MGGSYAYHGEGDLHNKSKSLLSNYYKSVARTLEKSASMTPPSLSVKAKRNEYLPAPFAGHDKAKSTSGVVSVVSYTSVVSSTPPDVLAVTVTDAIVSENGMNPSFAEEVEAVVK